MQQPLAEKMRPATISEIVGQTHLVGETGILRRSIAAGQPVSLILWGPPGSGKTTLARILASESQADFIEISAVSAGMADVRKVVERARANRLAGRPTTLFVDEIHRFNKAQQDAFLPHVESGLLTLIGATTENPSFEVIAPLLSRTRVLVLDPLSKADLVKLIQRAAAHEGWQGRLTPEGVDMLAELASGDARVALSNLELVARTVDGSITVSAVEMTAQRKLPKYDKVGEDHYNVISAFIKSMRGGDTGAALYYMARMIQAGEDPKYIARRMIIFASEDIGLVDNSLLTLAVSTFLAIERVGLPEGKFALVQCVMALAQAPKSRSVIDGLERAEHAARTFPDAQVPLHLRNARTPLMRDLGYQRGYEWKTGFVHPDGFLPPEVKDALDRY